jgi:hypothetical protein
MIAWFVYIYSAFAAALCVAWAALSAVSWWREVKARREERRAR